MLLTGKVAIITGANRGIGLSTARLFAREGAAVVLAGPADAGGPEAAAAIGAAGGRATFVATDVSVSRDVTHMVEAARDAFGGIDALVNNAGLDVGKPLLETTEEDWDLVQDVNLKGHFLCAKAVVPHMAERGGGTIVNTSSVLALSSLPGCGAYCASKGAILSLTRSMALEWGPLGIRVNCILPGPTDTAMMWAGLEAEEIPEERRRVEAATPLGRVADPEEIAQASLWFCASTASFATGSLLLVDGGMTTRTPSPR